MDREAPVLGSWEFVQFMYSPKNLILISRQISFSCILQREKHSKDLRLSVRYPYPLVLRALLDMGIHKEVDKSGAALRIQGEWCTLYSSYLRTMSIWDYNIWVFVNTFEHHRWLSANFFVPTLSAQTKWKWETCAFLRISDVVAVPVDDRSRAQFYDK
jgi:hypothetical protein